MDLKESTTLQTVTSKLKLIFGNPVKTLRQIRTNHIKTGHINHASSAKRFEVVMNHKLLIDHTEACIASATDKSEAEGVLYIRDEVYQLIQLIPKTRRDLARAMFMTGSDQGFYFSHTTTAKEMYQFFKTTIRDLYTDLEAEVSITSSSQLPTHQAFTVAHDNPENNPTPPAAAS